MGALHNNQLYVTRTVMNQTSFLTMQNLIKLPMVTLLTDFALYALMVLRDLSTVTRG